MHRRPYYVPPPSRKPTVSKSSKLIWIVALLTACVVPYLLVNLFSAQKNNHYTQAAIELPPQPDTKEQSNGGEKSASEEESWVTVKAESGDSLATLFKRVGLGNQTVSDILQHNKYAKQLTHIKVNQSFQMLIRKNILENMIVQIDGRQTLEVFREKGHYVTKLHSKKMDVRETYLTATVQYSLYSTAKRNRIPYNLIQQMTHIFEREINFAKDVRGGDRFTILYKASYMDNKIVSAGEIIAVTYTNRGVLHQAFRHETADGEVDYYTPDGQSMKPGFSRYPIKYSRINSPFSLSRMHPILHYHRPHKGVDLAAPMGTPVLATGDGRVEMLGYDNGYGNVIKIVHNNHLYTTVYAHLLKFKKGLFRGSNVKRGEVIGYVGKSGLATGPHCHYEFHVNHRPRNPSTVPLPHGSSVPSRDLAAFKAHADKLIEHLKLFEEAHQVSKQDHKVG